MSELLRHGIVQFAGALGALCACAYSITVLWAGIRFARNAKRQPEPSVAFCPPVSILKSMRGVDPGMYESLRSHCLQDYPEYEIIFGVSSMEDTSVRLLEHLKAEFPQRAIRIVYCKQVLGTNLKVSKLAQMLPLASHGCIVVNDSDIRVPEDYLRKVSAPLADPAVGMVTCLYRGVPSGTLGSRLESLGISTDFAGGVLVAREMEGMAFGLGSTMVFSRPALEAIGGFHPVLDYLADDYQLGSRIARSGLEVRLSEVVVQDFLPAYDFRKFLEHQIRWARTIRDSRRWGYVGLAVTYGIPWAVIALAFSAGAPWAWVLLAVTVALRMAASWFVSAKILNDSQSVRDLWLLPLRDAVALGIWIASFAGHRIEWRGQQYVLKDGKLRPA